jgi:pyruvate-formate lyase-activating enzyme
MNLSLSQVADAFDVTPQHVSRLAREGELPYVPTPLGRLYSAEEVEAIARERRLRARRDRRVRRPRALSGAGRG